LEKNGKNGSAISQSDIKKNSANLFFMTIISLKNFIETLFYVEWYEFKLNF